jgi:hypothetical protein
MPRWTQLFLIAGLLIQSGCSGGGGDATPDTAVSPPSPFDGTPVAALELTCAPAELRVVNEHLGMGMCFPGDWSGNIEGGIRATPDELAALHGQVVVRSPEWFLRSPAPRDIEASDRAVTIAIDFVPDTLERIQGCDQLAPSLVSTLDAYCEGRYDIVGGEGVANLEGKRAQLMFFREVSSPRILNSIIVTGHLRVEVVFAASYREEIEARVFPILETLVVRP